MKSLIKKIKNIFLFPHPLLINLFLQFRSKLDTRFEETVVIFFVFPHFDIVPMRKNKRTLAYIASPSTFTSITVTPKFSKIIALKKRQTVQTLNYL